MLFDTMPMELAVCVFIRESGCLIIEVVDSGSCIGVVGACGSTLGQLGVLAAVVLGWLCFWSECLLEKSGY